LFGFAERVRLPPDALHDAAAIYGEAQERLIDLKPQKLVVTVGKDRQTSIGGVWETRAEQHEKAVLLR
jgi:hypothetical protein